MAAKDKGITEETRRRKRINRMKSVILSGITVWMIVSILAIAVLSYQTMALTAELRQLRDEIERQPDAASDAEEQIAPERDATEAADDRVLQEDRQDAAEETGISEPEDVVAAEEELSSLSGSINAPENIATEEDAHLVYLTFDSEPGENTEEILKILKKYNVNVTFFVSAGSGKGNEKNYRRIVSEGHTLGMHSYSGKFKSIYKSAAAFRKDLHKISNYLFELTGERSRFYRFPGGSGNEISNVDMQEFIRILSDEGITYFDWNVAAPDSAEGYRAQDVIDTVVEGVDHYKTSVVLLHDGDGKGETIKALGPLIEKLKEKKAKLLPIDGDTYPIQYISADSVE